MYFRVEVVEYVYVGDANLDDFADFVILSNNFGDGVTNGNGVAPTPAQLAQYNAMAASLGATPTQIAAWDAQIAALPEPGAVALLAMGAVLLLARRRLHSDFPKVYY